MAVLPSVTAQRPAPRPSRAIASISPAAAGAVGNAYAALGDGVEALGFQIQEREATAAAKDADVRAAEEIRKLLYDPETGFANLKGGAAVAARGATSERLKGIVETAVADLPERAKQKARDSLAGRIERGNATIDTHTSSERTTWINGASQARIESSYQDGLLDLSATPEVLARIESELRGQAARNGDAPEKLAGDIATARSKLFTDQATAISANDPVAAMDYIRQNADSILPTDMANIEAGIGKQARRAEGEAIGALAYDTRLGVSESYLAAIRSAESGGNDSAKNPMSTATGRYQFTASTWEGLIARRPELGLTADGRLSGDQQEIAIRAFTADNAKSLAANGIPATNANLYAAHFLGAGGAATALRADGATPMSDVVGPEVISANGFLTNMTVDGFKAWTARKAGDAGSVYSNPEEVLVRIPDPLQRDAALARYRELGAMDAGRRKDFETRVNEDIAFAMANGVTPPQPAYNEAVVDKIYPPDDAAEVKQAYAQAVADAEVMYGVNTATPEQLSAQIAQATAKVREPGFTTEDVSRLNSLQTAINARETAIREDAALLVQRSSKTTAMMWDAYGTVAPEQKAQAAQNYVASVDFNYDRLGVFGEFRTVLPKQSATAIAKQFNDMAPDVAAQSIVQFSNDWGGAAPRVMKELGAAGLAPEYSVAMRHADKPGLASQIMSLRGQTVETLTKGVAPASVTDAERRLGDSLTDFIAVFEAGDATGEATRIIGENYAVAKKMTLQMVRQGADPTTAAEQTIEQLFPETVMDEPNAKVILPVGADERAVSRFLDTSMSEDAIRAFDPAPMDDPRLPEFADQEVMISAAQSGMWLTNSTGDGATLHLNVGGYFIPVMGRGGDPYEVKFADAPDAPPRVRFGLMGWVRN